MAVREVTFRWSDEKGECEDCGNPAAYSIDHTPTWTAIYCSVCAAFHASEGSIIVWLWKGEYA